ncbi:glycosyltransferase family 2 protein [Demequina sp. NBRC 110053]|uniref:glycosyltransferase family 2 protein n=1 Tax=Demequina sp. NBRC 110053 TaxID=1570342 RepID=UPI0009FCCA3A|nr:glycosyltransferase family 2 protein [Demequina sp. NBRC 110053]
MIDLSELPSVPPVSVVMAVRNEAAELAAAVSAVLDSGYAGDVEVVIAVGPSGDGTEDIAAGLAQSPHVSVVENPSGRTPDGLNAAIAASAHDVVVRMDGHARMPRGYIALAVDALRSTGAANVGGRMVPVASAPFSKAVAVAMSSRFGLGGAGHRQGGTEGAAESVYLGVFRRGALEAVGLYDERFERAQDWELNFRLRAAGGTVWFVPEMAVPYTPRASWSALRRQFFTTGQWRREVFRRHPDSWSARYVAAPAATVGVAAGAVVGAIGWALGSPAIACAALVPAAYVVGVVAASLLLLPRTGLRGGLRMPVVLATMHLAWGAGFLRGVRYSRLDA